MNRSLYVLDSWQGVLGPTFLFLVTREVATEILTFVGPFVITGHILVWILNVKRASITQRLENLIHLKHPIRSSITGPAFPPAVRTLVCHREIYWGHEVIIYVSRPLLQGQSF